jgi:hypothetical protein
MRLAYEAFDAKEIETRSTMQDDTAINPVTFVEMEASVGSILFLWSSIEREITKRVEELDDGQSRTRAHTLAQKIARWESLQASVCTERPEHQDLLMEVRTRLMMALELRNRISHGLIGITADPFGNRGDAHLETELNGEKRKHARSDLEHVMRILSHMAWAIGSLSDAARQTDPREAENAYVGIRLNHLP